jgi:uncharacterized protein
MLKRRLGLVAAGALLAGLALADEVAIPPLKARVTDLTATLSASEIQALETRLREFERRKGSQIAVLILPSTQPETIEQYSIRVAEAWKIGRSRVDDGAILVVAKNDRRLRVEVGRGLEGVIPDAIAKRVVSDVIAPRFKANDFYGGVSAGADALIKLIDGEPLPAPPEVSGTFDRAIDFHLISILVIALLVSEAIFKRLFGRVVGATIAGGIVGVIVWIVAGVLVFAVLGGMAGFLVALFVEGAGAARRGGWSSRGRGGSRSSSDWSGGGWSGGGWSGGGGDSGGFSGGGGDFGGSGASGSW